MRNNLNLYNIQYQIWHRQRIKKKLAQAQTRCQEYTPISNYKHGPGENLKRKQENVSRSNNKTTTDTNISPQITNPPPITTNLFPHNFFDSFYWGLLLGVLPLQSSLSIYTFYLSLCPTLMILELGFLSTEYFGYHFQIRNLGYPKQSFPIWVSPRFWGQKNLR